MRILIGDDDEGVRRGVKELLSSEPPWEVCGEAIDGIETLRRARELLPDVVLLDISMPGLNGLEVASLLRQELPRVKVIVMSQHDPKQVSNSVIQSGAHACVGKDLLSSDLLPIIKNLEVETKTHRTANAS